jgi:pyruvate kinase
MVFMYSERYGKVRTKIVATIGPASRDPERIRQLVGCGVDVFRINLSHGTQQEHATVLEAVRRVGAETDIPLAVLADLCGPKIRLGSITGDVVACDYGAEFLLSSSEGAPGDAHHLRSTYPSLPDDLREGQNVLFADGTISMEVVARGPGWARLKVLIPGLLRSHQGINVPQAWLGVERITTADHADLDWEATHPVDYLGLSFVRTADDVAYLRSELARRGSQARIVAKIETASAVANLAAIIAESDAVMVARGDLGVEMDVTRVPAIQKQIIAMCRQMRVPVITATQMLTTMESASRPTRAEASDVFNAVLDGTDAVMLSGETAIGQHPVEAVAVMSRILAEAESFRATGEESGSLHDPSVPTGPGARDRDHQRIGGEGPPTLRASRLLPITESIVEAASLVSRRVNAALLLVVTHSGRTALVLSKHRNPAATLALAPDPETARAMALYWGVMPVLTPAVVAGERLIIRTVDWCRSKGLIATGDRVVCIRGSSPEDPAHNEIAVLCVGDRVR